MVAQLTKILKTMELHTLETGESFGMSIMFQ